MMLSYERYETLKQVLEHNMNNAGYPFDLFIWDNGSQDKRVLKLLSEQNAAVVYANKNEGIARPFNELMDSCYLLGYDAFHVMANDILEPDNWLADKITMIGALNKLHIPLQNGELLGSPTFVRVKSGMVSIAPGSHNYPEVTPCFHEADIPAAGYPSVYYPGDVIGQFMITREVYEKIGGFNEEFGYYGPIDNDYNARCAATGFVNYYIPGQSQHIDTSPADLYGYNKAAAVAKTWPIHVENVKRYQENPESCYMPVSGECIVNMKQFWDGKDNWASK